MNWKKLSIEQQKFFLNKIKKEKSIVKISYLFFISIYLISFIWFLITQKGQLFDLFFIIYMFFLIISFFCFYLDLKQISKWNVDNIIYLDENNILIYDINFKKLEININGFLCPINITNYQGNNIKNNKKFYILDFKNFNNDYHLYLESEFKEYFGNV